MGKSVTYYGYNFVLSSFAFSIKPTSYTRLLDQ